MLASIAEPMEQREPSSLLEWPSRDRGRRSQRERFRPKVKNIRRDIERWARRFVFTPLALWRGVLALQASFGRAGGEALSVWSQEYEVPCRADIEQI